MKKINNIIEKNIKKILTLFIFIQPLLDVIAALTQNYLHIELTLSSIIRLIFFIFCIYYIYILDNTENNKKNKIYTTLILTYITFFSISTLVFKDINAITYELKNTINTFYLPIVLISLLDMFKQYKIKHKFKYIFYVYIIYLTFIIIPNITNTGFNSYWQSKTGSTGWFISANAVGNILSILLPLIILYLLRINKNKIICILTIISTLYAFVTLGTKVPVLSLLICIITTLLYYLIKWIKEKKYKNILITLTTTIITCVISIILIPKTSFYKNIQIHKEYLGFNNYLEVITNYELIDHFIFSQRLTFLKNTRNNFKKANIIEKLIGIGYIENYGTNNVSTKTIEIDYAEVFYRNGIIGFIIYFSILIKEIINTLKKLKKQTLENIEYKTSIILILILAIFSGHILVAPAVSIFVALIITLIQGGLNEKINER